MDNDHISGIKELFDLIEIDYLFLPDTNLIDESYIEIENLARNHNVKIVKIKSGDSIDFDNLKLKCIYPIDGLIVTDKNDSSMVLSLNYKEFNMLFTGDLSEQGEKKILNNLMKYNVLKVGHHGSKTSSSIEFLEKIKPDFSLISVGKNNRYNHPNPETIKRLNDVNSNILTTKDLGAIIIYEKFKKIYIKSWLD